MSDKGSKSPYAEYNEKLSQISDILNKNNKDISDKDVDKVVDITMDILKGLAFMHSESGKIRDDVNIGEKEQFEIAKNYLDYVKRTLTTLNNNKELVKNAYKYTLKNNPFIINQDDERGDIFAHISNQILLSAASNNKNFKPSISKSVATRNTRSGEKTILNSYNKLLEAEEEEKIRNEAKHAKEAKKALEEIQKEIERIKNSNDLSNKEKEEQINTIVKEMDRLRSEKDKLKEGIKISKNQIDTVVGGVEDILKNTKAQNTALGELLKKNKSDILNDVALRLAGDPDLKKNIRKIKGDLKAANKDYSDGDINYIITKALSENERYLKTVAANPDLFERDMSNDTIQKENEQFQSKLRQQNLRYILPKFIERREKLVENTLNPNLLKGAFAI